MPGPYILRPLRGEPRQVGVLAFDVEGVGGQDGFICGAIAGEFVQEFYTDRASMWRALLEHGRAGSWLFAHNLDYDLPIVAGPELTQGNLVFKRSGLLQARFGNPRFPALFVDSLNLYPRTTVKEMGQIVGLPKLGDADDLIYRIQTGERWPDFNPEERSRLELYCVRDAEIVFLGVRELQELILELGGQLRSTIGSASLDIFRRRFMKRPWAKLSAAANELARPALYGGRVENFAMGLVPGVNKYDVNSLYPAIQAKARFPHPDHLHLWEGGSLADLIDHWEGVAAARLHVPESWTPPLPYRLEERLFFPTGELSGVWPIVELRAAARRGVQILGVDWALGSPVTFSPFTEFIETLYKERLARRAAGDGRQALLKNLLNYSYGRFGLNSAQGLQEAVPILDPKRMKGLEGYVTGQLGEHPYAFGPVQARQQPAYVNVLFAAQVTAEARLYVLAQMEQLGSDLYYTETDSLITRGRLPVGAGLGSWKLEMEGVTADLIAPKAYAIHNQGAASVYHVKGVPPALAREYLQQGHARLVRARRVREALRTGQAAAEWVELPRELRAAVPKRRPERPAEIEHGGWTPTLPWPADLLETELRRVPR